MVNDEVVKRLAPTTSTLRKLYTLSGNLCAYPNCNQLMFNIEGNFVGKICHIEAAMPGGERFNPDMTNEDRRSFDNLILLCDAHHIETDKVDKYPVVRMKEIKKNHESKFLDNLVVEKMTSSLRDYTDDDSFEKVSNLEVLFDINYPNNINYGKEISEIETDVEVFNSTIEAYLNLSHYARRIFLYGLKHSHHPLIHGCREDEKELYVDFREVARKLGEIYRGDVHNEFRSAVDEIEANNLMFITEVSLTNEREDLRHIYTNASTVRDNDLCIWLELKKFCNNTDRDVVGFIEKLDFSVLDGENQL